jgi:hypothetical protein
MLHSSMLYDTASATLQYMKWSMLIFCMILLIFFVEDKVVEIFLSPSKKDSMLINR